MKTSPFHTAPWHSLNKTSVKSPREGAFITIRHRFLPPEDRRRRDPLPASTGVTRAPAAWGLAALSPFDRAHGSHGRSGAVLAKAVRVRHVPLLPHNIWDGVFLQICVHLSKGPKDSRCSHFAGWMIDFSGAQQNQTRWPGKSVVIGSVHTKTSKL